MIFLVGLIKVVNISIEITELLFSWVEYWTVWNLSCALHIINYLNLIVYMLVKFDRIIMNYLSKIQLILAFNLKYFMIDYL